MSRTLASLLVVAAVVGCSAIAAAHVCPPSLRKKHGDGFARPAQHVEATQRGEADVEAGRGGRERHATDAGLVRGFSA